MLSIKFLEVEPVAGILQYFSVRVNKGVCPFSEAMVDDVWAIPHRLELDFGQLIIGLVIDYNHIAFAEGMRVGMGVIVDLWPCFHCLAGLEGSSAVFYGFLKLEESLFQKKSIKEEFNREEEGWDLALYRDYWFNAMY